MQTHLTRREFLKALVAGWAGLGVPRVGRGESGEGFSFVVLGDLHFDRLEYHDLELLQKEKPDDVRQVREYDLLTSHTLPRLFKAVGDRIAELEGAAETRARVIVQLGDLVEGLCRSEEQARKQDRDAVEFVRRAGLGVPFLFTKGNHDITGPGAGEAFKSVFNPFLSEQLARLNGGGGLSGARYTVEQGDALFCFFDAYDKESLGWLEGALERRTARHCFVMIHPPVVPYGARATWHVFSSDREKAQRERLLELLGKHKAFVLSGHIHKYSLVVRATPRGGRFVQLGLSSVIHDPEAPPQHVLSGVRDYNGDQVSVEPNFSPDTQKQRRAVYQTEAPFVRQFQYADQPGYAVVEVNGPKVEARIYAGVSGQVWRRVGLSDLLAS